MNGSCECENVTWVSTDLMLFYGLTEDNICSDCGFAIIWNY